jgi:tetratricopeptide (TPR) repeat protein
VLNRQNKAVELNRETDLLLQAEPANPAFRVLKAAALARIGEFDAAIAIYEAVLKAFPDHVKVWLSRGHALKSAGRNAESVGAYSRAIDLMPSFGEAWWSLANLKTYRFTPEQVSAMRVQLGRADLSHEDRLHLEFALGKALEDAGDWAGSFDHYAEGNRLRRHELSYDAADLGGLVERSKALFTREFFAARAGQGDAAADPIFVVGLPRSGSTLIEQILASHSAVEGTQELAEIVAMARGLGQGRPHGDAPLYPGVLADLDPERLRALGAEYLERTRIQRKTDRPLFIDKMPNNFAHIGLISLILPNAKIIDARRHPMAVGFSAYKQHFAAGQNFSYDLEELGLYYRAYVELMDHVDQVLPGRVHRVIYERVVEDTEGEVRRLLDYCGLPFEPACLRFYENDRAVRTASSEQVRRPIFRDAVEHWRNYEPWLGPLKAALGPVLDSYPGTPREAGV